MKIKLKYLEGTETLVKSMTCISEVEVRQGHLEFWIRDDEGQSRIELSIKIEKVLSMVCFKHIAEKNMRKVKERKAKVKRGPYKRR